LAASSLLPTKPLSSLDGLHSSDRVINVAYPFEAYNSFGGKQIFPACDVVESDDHAPHVLYKAMTTHTSNF